MHGEEKMENGASVRPSFRPYILCSFNHYFILLILLFILTFFIPLFCTADSICWLNLSAASQQYFHSVTETLRTFLSSTSSYPSAHPVVHRLTCMDSTNFLSNGWKRRQNGENSALLLCVCVCMCWVDRGWGDGIITEPLSISKGMGITMN